MKMLLNNGTVINNAPIMSEKTRKYLNQFWRFPSKEETEKEKEKYYIVECDKRWQKENDLVVEHDICI
ncbi:MAG: hypothetical protein WAX81_03805 [Candidatus Moraniibacteriota bacterium]